MSRASDLEAAFYVQAVDAAVLTPECEYKFHPHRRWRFDFAWPALMVAVEVEGGTWSNGRHTRGSGFVADCEKYNTATLLGWTVFRLTSRELDSAEFLSLLFQHINEKTALAFGPSTWIKTLELPEVTVRDRVYAQKPTRKPRKKKKAKK